MGRIRRRLSIDSPGHARRINARLAAARCGLEFRRSIAYGLVTQLLAQASAHEKFGAVLERLLETGLYGHDVAETLVRLAEERARQVVETLVPPKVAKRR